VRGAYLHNEPEQPDSRLEGPAPWGPLPSKKESTEAVPPFVPKTDAYCNRNGRRSTRAFCADRTLLVGEVERLVPRGRVAAMLKLSITAQ